MSDNNTDMADLEPDLLSLLPVDEQTALPIHSHHQADRERNNSGSDSGSDLGIPESSADSSDQCLVSGSIKTVTASMVCSKKSRTNDRQKDALLKSLSNPSRKDKLAITDNSYDFPINENKEYTSRRKTFDSPYWPEKLSADKMANAGMIYKGPCKDSNGEIVFDMVECCECHKTMYDFKPDEDPLVEHKKLHPKCKRFQE